MPLKQVDRFCLTWRTGFAGLSLGLVLFAGSVSAGVVGEPNIVYANLSDVQDKAVDAALKAAINSPKPECWVKGAGLIYMKKPPPGMTTELIGRALLRGSQSAKRSLSKALLSFRDDDVSGFDGVVAYTDKPLPRFVSMTAKTLAIHSQHIADVRNIKDVELAFCAVKPDVVRSP